MMMLMIPSILIAKTKVNSKKFGYEQDLSIVAETVLNMLILIRSKIK